MKKSKGKKKIIKRVIIIAVIIILLALCILPRIFAQDALPTVNVIQAVTGDVEEVLDTSGMVASGNTKTYFSPVNAKINTCDVQVGSIIKKGDKLLEYDMDDLQKQYEQATLQTKATNYGNQAQIEVSNKSAANASQAATEIGNLQSKISAKEAEIAALQEQLTNASSADAGNAEKIANKIASLKEEATKISKKKIEAQSKIDSYLKKEADGTITEKESRKLSDLQSNMITWGQREVDIQAELEGLSGDSTDSTSVSGIQSQLEALNVELQTLQGKLAEQEAMKESSESAVMNGSQKAQLDAQDQIAKYDVMSAEELLEKAKGGITADFDGIVSAVTAVSGATSAQGEQLFTIAQADDIKIDISLSKYDLEKVKLNQSVTVTIAGTEYKGTVTKINRIAETNDKGATLVKAEVHVNNPDDNIIIGIEAKVKIDIDSAKNVVLVPVQAINSGQDGNFCYVVEDNKVVKKPVTTGVTSTKYVEVKKGLTQGEKVITDVGTGIEEGKVVIASEQENQVMEAENADKKSKDAEETK